VSLRSAVPRSHKTSGRASPRSSSWVGHSASPGTITRSPLSCQAASRAVAGTSPSRSRHRCTDRCSAPSSRSPASTASPSASAPVTRAPLLGAAPELDGQPVDLITTKLVHCTRTLNREKVTHARRV
jgi:hypothetical protein